MRSFHNFHDTSYIDASLTAYNIVHIDFSPVAYNTGYTLTYFFAVVLAVGMPP
jgi:hypothetical protein